MVSPQASGRIAANFELLRGQCAKQNKRCRRPVGGADSRSAGPMAGFSGTMRRTSHFHR